MSKAILEAYDDAHSTALELGYPSLTEALEELAVIKNLRDAQAAEIARLRGMLKPQWFYLGDDQSSDQCRFSPFEVVDEDFFGRGDRKKEGPHLVYISTALPGPEIWAVVRVLTDAEKDARQDDEPWLIKEYATEEEARAALAQETQP